MRQKHLAGCAMVLVLTGMSFSQTQSLRSEHPGTAGNKASILLTATVPSQLRLSLSEAYVKVRVSDPAQRSALLLVPVTSYWALDSSSSNVELVGFFDSPLAALSDETGRAIPASHVLGGISENDMRPFTDHSAGISGACRTFFLQSISRQNATASRSDLLRIRLDPIADLNAPAAEYRGLLHLRLIAF